jgi:uncharacterized membrane protein YccC
MTIVRSLFTFLLVLFLYFMFRMERPPMLFPESDKVLHGAAFLILVVMGGWAFRGCGGCQRLLAVFIVVLAVGAEFVQGSGILPQRSFDWWDLLANLIGCCIGLALLLWARKRTRIAKRRLFER